MGYLAYIIAGIWLLLQDTVNMTSNQAVDMFLDQAVVVNKWIFWVILAVYLLVLVISGASLFSGSDLLGSLGLFGTCMTVFMVGAPIIQGVVWWMSSGMANAFGPMGITDPIKFWVLAILTLLLGTG